MKDAREIHQRAQELLSSLAYEQHPTPQLRTVLELVVDLAESVASLQKRILAEDASDELEL